MRSGCVGGLRDANWHWQFSPDSVDRLTLIEPLGGGITCAHEGEQGCAPLDACSGFPQTPVHRKRGARVLGEEAKRSVVRYG
jgi:hypothetical protein